VTSEEVAHEDHITRNRRCFIGDWSNLCRLFVAELRGFRLCRVLQGLQQGQGLRQ
jgi:hypothetical protein